MSDNGNPQAASEGGAAEGQSQSDPVLGGTTNTAQSTETTQQTQTNDFQTLLSTLPDDIKTAKSLESINNFEDLAKSYVNAQSFIGKKFEDLTPEQLNDVYGKLGRPESPEGYKFENTENDNPELSSWFSEAVFDIGLNQEQAATLREKYNEFVGGLQKEQEGAIENLMADQEKQLKQDFGPAYNERVELANRALSSYGGEELVEALKEAGMQNNPALVKAFAAIGMDMAEGKFVEGEGKGKFGMSSEEATQQIDALRKDEAFMKVFTDPTSSKHKQAIERMENLYKIKTRASA